MREGCHRPGCAWACGCLTRPPFSTTSMPGVSAGPPGRRGGAVGEVLRDGRLCRPAHVPFGPAPVEVRAGVSLVELLFSCEFPVDRTEELKRGGTLPLEIGQAFLGVPGIAD